MEDETIKEYRCSLECFFSKFCDMKKQQYLKITLLESLYIVYEKCGAEVPITDELIDRIKNVKFSNSARQGTAKKNTMNERWKGVYGTIKEYIGNGG